MMREMFGMTSTTENRPFYDVLIATPGKMLHAEYVESLVETTKVLNELGLSYKFLNKQSSFIPSGRELTATNTYAHNWETREVGSGEFGYGRIFWIDSDVEWTPEAFLAILKSEHPIIGGLYQTSPDGTVAVAKFDDKGLPRKVHESEFIMEDEPIEVFGLGFGFIAMEQGIFETMDRPWFKIEQIQWDGFDFTTNVGEDYSWCMNARRNGFKIMLDPTVKVRHHKETIYELR
jgi:hypothetical protein